MKYIIGLCTCMLFTGSAAFSQSAEKTATPAEEHSFKSVRGHEVLPQAGEWGIGISATGFLGYLGNMMNNSSSNNAPSFTTANAPNAFAIGNIGGMAVMGKYMKSATLAYRFRFQANAGSTTYRNNVLQSTFTPDPLNPKFVEDNMITDAHVVLLGAGFEKRRGTGRVQGFMGAELLAGVAGNKKAWNYGNNFSVDFPAPVSTTDFGTGASSPQQIRMKESYSGTTMLFGARGFAGVEYFIAPKLSLGGEIGYTLGFSTTGKGYSTTERWNAGTMANSTVSVTNYPNSGLRSFGAGLDNINAGINLHFYF